MGVKCIYLCVKVCVNGIFEHMKHLTLLFFLGLISCNQHKADSKAKQLTDSAITIWKNTHDDLKALPLLDQALETDSNYFPALSTKLSFELTSNMPDKALRTAKSLIRIKPEVAEYYTAIGLIYEQKHDTISSKKYFTDAIICYDKKLDTMSKSDKKYDMLLSNKAIDLIFIGEQEEGNKILKEIYDRHTDEDYREMVKPYMNKSKQEILNNH